MKSIPWRGVGRGAVTAVLAFTLIGLAASPAAAHNRLRSSTPADGATLATAPSEARLNFAERIDPGSTQVAVTDESGGLVPSAAYRVDGVTLIQPLALPRPGRYQVGFRVISPDGHPVTGKITFTVTSVPSAASPTPTRSPQAGPTLRAYTSASAASPGSTVAAGDGGSDWTTPALVAGGVVLLGALTFALVARRRRDGGPADGEPAG